MFEKRVGVIHNKYIIKGGEDEVASAEFHLLLHYNIKIKSLTFSNPGTGINALIVFFLSIFNPFTFFLTYSWLKKNKIQILHVHNWFFKASPSVFWAAKFLKVPVVVTLHNYRLLCPSGTLSLNGKPYLESLNRNFPIDAIKKGVYRHSKFQTFWVVISVWLNKKIGTWKIPKTFIVLTENSKNVFINNKIIDKEKIVIKPNFFSEVPFISALQRTNSFLFIGRLSQEKGIEILLKAFENSTTLLTIVGDGPLKEQVELAVERNNNIRYLGLKSKPEILQLLTSSTALIFPSIWLETFGLTIIEAFATGTPVIASKRGSAEKLITNGYNGMHFEPENPDDLKSKTQEWLTMSPSKKIKFSENARRTYIENYTPEINFKQLITIYESAV